VEAGRENEKDKESGKRVARKGKERKRADGVKAG